MKILLAVDGSEHCLRAADQIIALAAELKTVPEVHVLFVHPPVPSGLLKEHVSHATLDAYYRDEGELASRDALDRLNAAGLRPQRHLHVGPPAENILRYADRFDCDWICLGRHGRSALADMVMGSVARAVLHLSRRPVLLVR